MPRWTPENRPSIDSSKPATTGVATETRQLLIDRSSGLRFFSPSPRRVLAVRMWESRVLCEISKALWKPFCGFHGAVICIAIFGIVHDRADRGGCCTLAGVPIVVPRGSYAVVLDLLTRAPAQRQSRVRGHARHMVLLRGLVGAQVGLDLGAPAPRSAFEDVRVMEQPIQERGDGGRVAQQLPPVVHRSV